MNPKLFLSIAGRHSNFLSCCFLVFGALLTPAPAVSAPAGLHSEFIPFPEVTLHFANKSVGDTEQNGAEARVDFLYSAKLNDWRFLTEIVVGDAERDIERLALGKISPSGTQLWLGRYHTAIGQWNHKFHHGMYLQTSIHRPSIIEFEDDGGAIPAHATGIRLGGQHEMNDRMIEYMLEFGLGPELGKEGMLEPFTFLNVSKGEHDLAVTAKLTSHAIDDPFDDSGVFAGYIRIPSDALSINEIQQTILGAYSNLTTDQVAWRGSLFFVRNNLDLGGGNSKGESFAYAYLQPEYNHNTLWIYYGRWEKSLGAKQDLYIQQIPSFVTERSLLGIRYQMSGSQALKFEASHMEQYGKRFMMGEAQWSAALP